MVFSFIYIDLAHNRFYQIRSMDVIGNVGVGIDNEILIGC